MEIIWAFSTGRIIRKKYAKGKGSLGEDASSKSSFETINSVLLFQGSEHISFVRLHYLYWQPIDSSRYLENLTNP